MYSANEKVGYFKVVMGFALILGIPIAVTLSVVFDLSGGNVRILYPIMFLFYAVLFFRVAPKHLFSKTLKAYKALPKSKRRQYAIENLVVLVLIALYCYALIALYGKPFKG